MSYMGVILTFEWFSPILPSTHWTILALIGTIAPAIGFITIQNSLESSTKKRRLKRTKSKETDNVGWVTTTIICLIIIFFSLIYV